MLEILRAREFPASEVVAFASERSAGRELDGVGTVRALSDDEAAEYRKVLDKHGPDDPSPYQRAAVTALRELTGKDAAPTADAWRKVLGAAGR